MKRLLNLLLVIVLLASNVQSFGAGLCSSLLEPTQESISRAYEKLNQGPKGLSNFSQHLKVTKQFIEFLDGAEKIQSADVENPGFNRLLKKVIFNSNEKLTVEEIRLLNKNSFHRRIFEGTLQLLAAGEFTGKAFQKMLLYWTGRRTQFYVGTEQSWQGKALQSLRTTYNGPVRLFAMPVVPLPRWNHPADAIINKKIKDPTYQPTDAEIEILKQHHAIETYETNAQFQKEAPRWSSFRRWVSRLLIAGIAINGAVVANWSLHLSKPEAFVKSDNFFSEPQYRLADNQVRVFNESVPFPHMAIEIGGQVYSYGQTHMTVTSTREYLLNTDIQEAAGPTAPNQNPGLLYRTINATGLNRVARSVQSVTLNLNKAQVQNLTRFLQMSNHHAYRNHTLAMDCATMIALALKNNTSVPIPSSSTLPITLDASPGGMMMYFGLLKSLGIQGEGGQPLVGDVLQVAMAGKDKPNMHLVRNLYINAVETRIALSTVAYNSITRGYLNVRYGTSDFQYLNPEVRKEIESWQGNIASELASTDINNVLANQLTIFKEEAMGLGRTPLTLRDTAWNERLNRLNTAVDVFLANELGAASARIQSPESTFSDVVKSAYRHDLLLATKVEIANLAQGRVTPLSPGKPGVILDGLLAPSRR